jgi:hypothetical protein
LGGFARLFGNYKLDMKGISGSFAFAKRLYSLLVVVEYVADPEFGLGIRPWDLGFEWLWNLGLDRFRCSQSGLNDIRKLSRRTGLTG